MKNEKRKEKRIDKNLLVYTDNGHIDLLGVSVNISRNGIYIESPKPSTVNDEISLVLAVDNELFKLKGEILWLKSNGTHEPIHLPSGMAIRITEAPAEYLNYVEYLKHTYPHPDNHQLP